MSDQAALFQQWEGKIVPRDFIAGFVVLSYLISWLGAWTTLELINRRTSARGLYNWSLLIGSSISMGAISIWCMHYIGNRAIILGDGSAVFQIAYNPGFTALSFFVPIIVLLITFMAVGANEVVSVIRVILGGTLAGLAICGMHYLGQASISNYMCIYQIPNVIGAAVIAILASVTALFVFFLLRASWTNSWWKRAATALILAGAVSGMHWLASVGTQYRLRDLDQKASATLGTSQTVIVVIVLSVAACLILLTLTLLAQRRRAKTSNRAQQVVLASVTFDADGRLMVTPEGLLPSQKITNSYLERSFDDVFAISHPVFGWLFRTSHNWPAITPWLPAMRNHINQITSTKGSRPGSKHRELRLTDDQGAPVVDYPMIFRELFCVAAGDLAARFNEPVENLGVLFDEILSTGQFAKPRKGSVFRRSPQSSIDLERDGVNLPVLGRGQLLFVVRQVEKRESDKLQAAGFRFASVSNVINILARSMEINSDDLNERMRQMKLHAEGKNILDPGLHIACFAVRANIHHSGFDIIATKDARNLLPITKIETTSDTPEPWHLEIMNQLDGLTVSSCRQVLEAMFASGTPRRDQVFASQVLDAIEGLASKLGDSFLKEALFVSEPCSVPCRGTGDGTKARFAHAFFFRLSVPVHARAPGPKFEFVPLKFYRLQQRVYKHTPDEPFFVRLVHREFGGILSQVQNNKTHEQKGLMAPLTSTFTKSVDDRNPFDSTFNSETLTSTATKAAHEKFSFSKLWNSKRIEEETIPPPSGKPSETSSEKNLVNSRPYGGILVSQEISIDVNPITNEKIELDGSPTKIYTTEMKTLGTKGEVGNDEEGAWDFVDRLLALCVGTLSPVSDRK